ncbi:MAG: GNAT family N-acetyltransferase [Kurthia sp.]|nr:GNAT family N-acetyltransferase [Candidatus Kurthia equi]
MSDLKLMKNHVEVLFQQNKQNQLTVINEPPFDDAPLLFIGLTKEGSVQRYSYKVDDLLKKRLQNIVMYQRDELVVSLINQLSNRLGFREFVMGPTYVFPKLNFSNEEVVLMTEENKELLKDDHRFTYIDFKMKQPCVVIIKNDKIISLCCSARQNNEAAEASVYTAEQYRGKGYGTTVTKAWAYHVQQAGKIALYSTTWDNLASQGVARTLGLHQYGVGLTMD